MKMIFNSFARRLLGVKYERLKRSLFLALVVFWGLYIAGMRVRIAPSVLYLTVSAFTAGVMWQALSSEDNAGHLQNILMLAFERRRFVLSYVAALGAYTIFTKTVVLLALLLAVSDRSVWKIAGCILCGTNAVLMAAGFWSVKRYRYICGFWAAGFTAAVLYLGNKPCFLPLVAVNGVLAFMLLQGADGYSFYDRRRSRYAVKKKSHSAVRSGRASIWRYFFRYLSCHKNYLVNTAVLWCVACVLPFFFGQMEDLSFVPVCFAILSLNTPVCILLSCDAALREAVRMLPGQGKAFCVPYCLFIFFCNMTADMIFLCSLRLRYVRLEYFSGDVGAAGLMIVTALLFALTSAVCSALLEWFFPIRDWRIESDLWHHPRKYVVPAAMLLLAGIAGALLTKL